MMNNILNDAAAAVYVHRKPLVSKVSASYSTNSTIVIPVRHRGVDGSRHEDDVCY